MNLVFNKSHPNTIKAGIKKIWHGNRKRQLLKVIIGLTFVSGILLCWLIGENWAWLFAVTAVTFTFYEWLVKDVMKEQGNTKDATIDTLNLNTALSADVLGNLEDPKSFAGIWESVQGSPRAAFIVERFGLSPFIFDAKLEGAEVAEKVWQEALRLSEENQVGRITGAEVIVALTKQIPGYEKILAENHIEYEDLSNGLKWMKYIIELKKYIDEETFLGGIARDWTAGYTPLLDKLGVNVSRQVQNGQGLMRHDIEAHQSVIDQMIKIFEGGQNNIALIGKVGIGKTTTVTAFAQYLLTNKQVPTKLRSNQIFRLDATTLRSGMDSGLEEFISRLFAESVNAKNVIIFLDDANMFLSEYDAVINLNQILQKVFEHGSVKIILSMTEEDWQKLQDSNPALTGHINQINIPNISKADAIIIFEDQVLIFESQNKVRFTYQSLIEAYRLADHYINDSVFPGRGIRLLNAATRFPADGMITESSVQQAMESMIGVKVQQTSHDERKRLINLEEEIHKRMINQTRAVKVVSDALRRARSGVTNPNRPLGTFLFLGPTGVGKTELSKAIAEVFFGGEANIIRVDMNQSSAGFALETDILAKIKTQPFSVVLLDEIEKAGDTILDSLLQMLDEGIMRDLKNNEVSFKDAIIIATSNAGADKIREYISQGKKLEEFEQQFINELIDSGIFKPEFINRFDETVVFRPLTKDELLQVVDLMLASINKTLARQKVSVTLDEAAKLWLVDKGYDQRLGARPLRRVVQRTVENIVSKKILDDSFTPGDKLDLTVQDLEQEVI